MTDSQSDERIPSNSELEDLFINNTGLTEIQTHLNRFNPIKVMKMESMEIRHSAILGWLLDPMETHGLGDRFLKVFLGEALKSYSTNNEIKAIDIIDADLRSSIVRLEWKKIDIFVECQIEKWAFVVENKFYSQQGKEQLKKYLDAAENALNEGKAEDKKYKIKGIFLTLFDEEPNDKSYSTIKYRDICKLLEAILKQNEAYLANEVLIFIRHYLDILKDANDMSEETNEMKQLARELYLNHRKSLDFIIEHGSGSDFSLAARELFGDGTRNSEAIKINETEFYLHSVNNSMVSFLPKVWRDNLGAEENSKSWKGCEKWWAGYPLIMFFRLFQSKDGKDGTLRLFAEVGSLSNHDLRVELIELIKNIKNSKTINFSNGADTIGSKYSRFFKKNSIKIDDIHDSELISKKMKELLKKFESEITAIGEALVNFPKDN